MIPALPAALREFYQRARARLRDQAPAAGKSRERDALLHEIKIYQLALQQQQEYLSSQNSLWETALEAVGDGAWDWDISSGQLHFSKAWAALNGYAFEDTGINRADLANIIHPDDKEATLLALQAHLDGKTPSYRAEHRLRSQDGSYKWVMARGMVVSRDADQNPLRMVGTHTDITHYKITEEALRTSARLIETAESISHVGSVELDVASGKVTWSAETYRIHEITPEEFDPQFDDTFAYYTEESRPIIAAALTAARKDGTNFDIEVEKYTFKGRKIHIRTTCLPSFENGKVIKLTGIIQDITEQKEKEQALREKDHLLSESQRIARIGSWSWNLASNEIQWTEGTYRLYGVDPDSFKATPESFFSLMHPEDVGTVQRWCQRCIEGERLNELEFRVIRPDGSLRIINGRGYLERGLDGKPLRLLGTVQDITERKQAEQRQQHQTRILSMLADKAPLTHILDSMARDVEKINPGAICTILLLDDTGQYLTHGAAPSLPQSYVEAINGQAIGEGVGSCGHAAFTGERSIVEDINSHPWWANYRALAQQAGLASCWSQPIRSAEGKVLGTFAIYHDKPASPTEGDITLIEAEASLAALAIINTANEAHLELAASVFSHAREGILITDAQGNIIDVNDTFTRITGYSRSEAIGRNPRLLQSGRHTPEFFTNLWNDLTEKGYWTGEIWNKRKNGELYIEMETISAVRDNTGKIINYVSLFNDITPLKEHQRQLEYIAHYDALTSLPNRVLLADRLQQALARSHRSQHALAVLYIDLDGFKAVNDSHGHDLGDQLLIAVSHRLKDALREGDTIARIGGDEFVVVLVDLTCPEDYQLILKRLLQAAAEPVNIQHHMLRVSASIGVTIYPQDGADADQLMRHADQAMYLAKQAGKNCYHLFDVAKDVAVKTQRESIEHIRQALDKRQFVLYYQPKVNMKTGVVIGAEALIRWLHPEHGLIPPGDFLPIIEDHTLSVELGDWVIDQALQQMSDWRAAGLDICISVNVGALQLQSPNFAVRLAELLTVHADVPPGHLELEILETSALDDVADVAALMEHCHSLGVHFAVDDFGTGYSSLTYLKRLPAELLKIDQSFVRDMLDDPDDLAIVTGVIGLARAFQRQVIAEGVESVAHGQLLLKHGCELAQGYGIAKPMPASALPQWIADWRPDAAWLENEG